jgi:type I restriction enzyme, S subunit
MAGEWFETTIGDQATLQRGVDITQSDQRPGPVPVISSGGVSSYHDTPAANGPGVILGRKGVVGSVWFVTSDYWPHDTTLWVKDFHGNDRRFVYYFFKWMAPRIARMDVGSANPTLNRNHVHPIEIRWPPLDEQRAIAHILGTLDDKIELNRRTNETLVAIARALFKSWFVDFDPVRAKVEGLDPGLSTSLTDLFPDSFLESELGEIPKGWKHATIAEYAVLNPESWSKETRPETIDYVDLSNTKWGRIESTTSYSWKDAPSRAQRVLRQGDTIVGTVRPGNGSYAFVAADGLTGSTGFAVLRPRCPEYAEFVYLAATDSANISALSHAADGGAYPAVRPEAVGATPAIRPARAAIARFSALCSPLFARMAQNERTCCALAAVRDMLLPKLLSEEVTITPTFFEGDLAHG